MTIKELIEHLGNFDPDLMVAYELYSGFEFMQDEDVREEELVFHKGRIEDHYPNQWKDHPGGAPLHKFVVFPGN